MLARRFFFLIYLLPAILLVGACSRPRPAANSSAQDDTASSAQPSAASTPEPAAEFNTVPHSPSQTKILMHNVVLLERPGFNLRVRWLRGEMRPTRANVIPSFDEPNSFVVDIQAGVVATNLGEISGLLNGGMLQGSPLEKVSLSADGPRLKLNGTLHKGLPLPIEMTSDVGVSPDGLIRLHVVKLRVLKVPVKGLLQSFHVKVGDLVSPKGATGVKISGDDIYLDAEKVLPAPAIRGELTDAHLGSKTGDLITVFGDARPEVVKTREWRNFIRLRGGTINFGKLTMAQADLVLIDASDDDWFDFDLMRYQEQLVNGRIQMTPEAGLRVFMPDIEKIPHTAENRGIIPVWMKNRNIPPPAEATQ